MSHPQQQQPPATHALQDHLITQVSQNLKLMKDMADLRDQLLEIQLQANRLNEEISILKAENKRCSRDTKALTEEKQALEARIADYESKHRELAQLDGLKKQTREQKDRIRELERELMAKRPEIEAGAARLSEKQIADYAKVQAMASAADDITGIVGRINALTQNMLQTLDAGDTSVHTSVHTSRADLDTTRTGSPSGRRHYATDEEEGVAGEDEEETAEGAGVAGEGAGEDEEEEESEEESEDEEKTAEGEEAAEGEEKTAEGEETAEDEEKTAEGEEAAEVADEGQVDVEIDDDAAERAEVEA
jgi:hypothetical protein